MAGPDTVLEEDVFNNEPGHAAKHNAVNAQVNWLTDNLVDEATLAGATQGLARFYRGNRGIALGDSITYGYSTIAANSGVGTYPMYAGILSNARLRIFRNAGTSGNRLDEMLARVQADVIAYKPDFCLVWGGINSIRADRTVADMTGSLTGIYDALEAGGVRPVAFTVLACSGSMNADRHARLLQLNTWIRTTAATRGYDLIDLHSESNDGAGGLRADWTTEAAGNRTHPDLAYQIIGQRVADTLGPRMPAIPETLRTVKSSGLRRNFASNPLMADGNADGIPDDYQGDYGTGGTYTHTIEIPQVGRDVDGNWAVVTTTAGATSRRLRRSWSSELAAGLAFASVGDRIAYMAKVDFAPGGTGSGGSYYIQLKGESPRPQDQAASGIRYTASGVAYGELVVPAGFDGNVALALTTGTEAGVFKVAEATILNLTRLGVTTA